MERDKALDMAVSQIERYGRRAPGAVLLRM